MTNNKWVVIISVIALLASIFSAFRGGPAGPQGSQGVQGLQGPIGFQGLQGAVGSQGLTGVAGPQGATGPQGPMGQQGIQGLVGPMGPVGQQGPQGIPGAGSTGSTIYGLKLLGNDTGSIQNPASGNYFVLAQFLCNQSGTLAQIGLQCTISGNVKVAAYSSAGALLAANNNSNPVNPGWNPIAVSTTPLVVGTYYWLAVISDTSTVGLTTAGTGTILYKVTPYSSFTFPAVWWSDLLSSNQGCLIAGYD